MKQIVLSLKENQIKAILVEKNGDSYDVISGATVELSPGSIEAGVIINSAEIKTKIQNLIGNISSAKSHRVSILLTEEASFLKVIRDKKGSDLLEDPKIQEEIPYSLKGSFSTLRLLKNKNIQIVAAKRELISSYQKLFKEVGLEIESLFPEPVVFLKFVEKSQKPSLVISVSGGSVLFVVMAESGIFFSTTKHFKEGVFDNKVLAGWIKAIMEQEIKPLSSKLDFETLVFGEHENEIFEELSKSKIVVKILNINLRKVPPQLNDVSKYKRLIITAGLNKHIPGFHVKGIRPASVVSPPSLPWLNLKFVSIGFLSLTIIIALVWLAPQIASLIQPTNDQTSVPVTTEPPPTIATPSAESTSSAKKDKVVQEKPKVEEKKEEPKPVLKRSSLKIEVLNGNGIPGTASEATTFLEGKGYKVISTGNADNYNYTKTELRLKKSRENYRELLTKDLSNRYTVISGTVLEESSSADVQVIVSK